MEALFGLLFCSASLPDLLAQLKLIVRLLACGE